MFVRRLSIDGKSRDLIVRIGDRGEIALGVIAKVVVWFSGAVTVAGGTRSSTAPHASILESI